jgi:hypothetical protein
MSGDGHGAHQVINSGVYDVILDRDMRNCRAVATLSRVPGTTPELPPHGEITTDTTDHGVTVRTFNSTGTPADLPFHLIAVC